MDSTNETVTKYLRALLQGDYLQEGQKLESDEPQLQEIAAQLHELNEQLAELKRYSLALAQGDLDVEFPPRNNYLAGGLKELHANLLHLIWKVNQIAEGNYGQKVDYMGQISEAFNQMAAMLAKRDLQLKQSHHILGIILSFSDISLFVLEKDTGEFIHGRENLNNYDNLLDMQPTAAKLVKLLQGKKLSGLDAVNEWELYSEEDHQWYMVNSMPGTWANSKDVYFHVLTNISETMELSERLQDAMYRDTKFSTYNEAYAIRHIKYLIKRRAAFSVCYLDLDNLKATNDSFGHDIGDRLIRHLVKIISDHIRPEDVLCRVGGDEFVLILINISTKDTQSILDRITDQTLHFKDVNYPSLRLPFSYGIETVSVNDYTKLGLKPCGTKECKEQNCGGPLCVINRADRKMYKQKRQKKMMKS